MSMTVEEAIENLKSYAENSWGGLNETSEMAISALEEVQQCREYREIFESHFTEDALKLFSDKEEFSKWFERGKWHVLKCDELGREVEAYKAIGTVSEFWQLKEKATAKKVDVKEWIYTKCDCGYEFSKHHGDGYYSIPYERQTNYCPNCGQRLLWD